MDWLVERFIRPLYDATAERFTRLVEQGHLPDFRWRTSITWSPGRPRPSSSSPRSAAA